ncbi:hypothetical protein ACJX0J_026927 [Zea mays]
MKQFKMDMLFFQLNSTFFWLGIYKCLCMGLLFTLHAIYTKFWTATWINAREKSLLETIGMLENENCETLTALFPLGQISYEFFADMYCFSYAIELMMPFWHNFIELIIFTFMIACFSC